MTLEQEAHAIRFVLKTADEAIVPPPADLDSYAGRAGWEKGCLKQQVRHLRCKLEALAAAFEAAEEDT